MRQMIVSIFLFVALSTRMAHGFQGVFWHVCDLHLNLSYKSDVNGGYGDYNSDSPFALIKSAFQQMKIIHPNPNFVIVNGDNVNHGVIGNEMFRNTIRNLSDEIRVIFPNTTILPSLGNHDVNPSSLLDVNSKWCETLFDYWKIFFTNLNESDIESFKKGCFYSVSVTSKRDTTLIIVLNTMLWYKSNSLVTNLTDPLDQFIWLKQRLQFARVNKFQVFILAHVPPGASEYSPKLIQHLHPQFNDLFLKILQNHSDIIDAGFFAHQHTDAFKIIYNLNGKPVIPLFLSPSVTPYHLWGLGSVNPSVRLYIWNMSSAASKYKQYHTNLTGYNNRIQNADSNWSLEYESTSIMPGLSANHLNDLLSDLEKPDSSYFDKFFLYHLSGRPHDDILCPVKSLCRCRIFCGMKNIDYTQLEACLDKCSLQNLSGWVLIVSVTIGVIVIIIIMSFIIWDQCAKNNRARKYETI